MCRLELHCLIYLYILKNGALFPFVYTLSDCLKCFTITGQAEQTNDVDGESGQVEDRKGIVLAKMENIKQYSTDDCNLTKPLQGHLTRHIKHGRMPFRNSRKHWQHPFGPRSFPKRQLHFGQDGIIIDLRKGSISIFFFFYLPSVNFPPTEGRRLKKKWLQMRRRTRHPRQPGSMLLAAQTLFWCATRRTPSTCSSKFTQGPENA